MSLAIISNYPLLLSQLWINRMSCQRKWQKKWPFHTRNGIKVMKIVFVWNERNWLCFFFSIFLWKIQQMKQTPQTFHVIKRLQSIAEKIEKLKFISYFQFGIAFSLLSIQLLMQLRSSIKCKQFVRSQMQPKQCFWIENAIKIIALPNNTRLSKWYGVDFLLASKGTHETK